MGLNSLDKLTATFMDVYTELKNAVKEDVKFLLKEEGGVLLEFEETVYTHFISDNNYVECKSVQLGDDGSLTFQCVENARGQFREYDDVLEDMGASSCYELLIGINDNRFTIKP